MVQRQHQRAGKIRSVKNAGGVTKMMIKAGKPPPGEQLSQMGEYRFPIGTFAVGTLGCGAAVGDRDGVYIGETQIRSGKNLGNRELRKSLRVAQPREFFFFDGGDDAAIVKKRRRRIRTGS